MESEPVCFKLANYLLVNFCLLLHSFRKCAAVLGNKSFLRSLITDVIIYIIYDISNSFFS